MSNVLSDLASGMNFTGIISEVFKWLGICLISVGALVIVFFLYHLLTFNMPVTIMKLTSIGNDKFGVTSIKKNRAKWNKTKTAWKLMKPFFNNQLHQPFAPENILAGNHIMAYEINGILNPVNISVEGHDVMAKPIKYNIRDWLSLQFKKNAEEFAKKDFWTENRQFFMVIGTVLFCCILVGVTIYFTFKFAAPRAEEISALTQAIKGLGNVAGRPAG